MKRADQEARRFNHELIDTEHILLRLIKEATSVASHVLKQLDVDPRQVRLEIERRVQSRPEMVTMAILPQTLRANQVIEHAKVESQKLRHRYVGTEHVLLGLLHDQSGLGGEVLMQLGLDLESAREEVIKLVGIGPEVAAEQSEHFFQQLSFRFTDRAQKVMKLANQEAQRSNHEHIGTEHVLLGLIKEGSGVGAYALMNLNLSLRQIRIEIDKRVQTGPETIAIGELPKTPRVIAVINCAVEESRDLNHEHIGTEHILLGLMRDRGGVARDVLVSLGLSLEEVRTEVSRLTRCSPDDDSAAQKHGPTALSAHVQGYLLKRFRSHTLVRRIQAEIEKLTQLEEQVIANKEFGPAASIRDRLDRLEALLASFLRVLESDPDFDVDE